MSEAPSFEEFSSSIREWEERMWDEAPLSVQRDDVLLDPQVTILHDIPQADEILDVTDRPWHKPTGGLWTSTLNDEGGEWLRWLTGEGYTLEMPRWGGKMWRLTPTPANLYVVLTPRDLDALVERYPHPLTLKAREDYDPMRMLVDWPRMAQDFDGVHIPNPWPWRFGGDLAAGLFFYAMDAECTCWFRWCFEGEPEELDPAPYLAKLEEES